MRDAEVYIITQNNKKRRKIGLLPSYIDGLDNSKQFPKKLISKIPFSSVHKTYKDYENDLLSTMKFRETEIPDELIERILVTQRELGLDKIN